MLILIIAITCLTLLRLARYCLFLLRALPDTNEGLTFDIDADLRTPSSRPAADTAAPGSASLTPTLSPRRNYHA